MSGGSMLNFLITRGGAESADLPTLVKLEEMLAQEDLVPEKKNPTVPEASPGPKPVVPLSAGESDASKPPMDAAAITTSVNSRLSATTTILQENRPEHAQETPIRSMLDFLVSLQVCGPEGIDSASFPTLTMLAQALAAEEDKGGKDGQRVHDVPAPLPVTGPVDPAPSYPQAPIEEAASPAPMPFAIPLPIVPGAKDWGVTHTVVVAPPPLPPPVSAPVPAPTPAATAQGAERKEERVTPAAALRPLDRLTPADLSSEVPTPLHRRQSQPEPAPVPVHATAATGQRRSSQSGIEVLAVTEGTQTEKPSRATDDATVRPQGPPYVALMPGRPRPRASRPVSAAVPGEGGAAAPYLAPRPGTGAPPTPLAGRFPRSVAAALQQRRHSAEGHADAAPGPTQPPARRTAFIDRYMEKLYARASSAASSVTGDTAGGCGESLVEGKTSAPPPPPAQLVHSVQTHGSRRPISRPARFEEVMAQLGESQQQAQLQQQDDADLRVLLAARQTRVRQLSNHSSTGVLAAPRYMYDTQRQQYAQMPAQRSSRPISAAAQSDVLTTRTSTQRHVQPQQQPVLPQLRSRRDRSRAGSAAGRRSSEPDLMIVGSRLEIPSVPPPTGPAVRPAGRYLN